MLRCMDRYTSRSHGQVILGYISSLEAMVMKQSPWHWVFEDNHLLLEPLRFVFMSMEHQQYITTWDTYKIDRGQEFK